MENNTAIQNTSADIISETAEKSQEDIRNIIQKAVEKVKKEAEIASGQNVPAVAIYNYLLDKCKDNEEFSNLVLVESKSISKCFTYITDKAFEMASRQDINRKNGSVMGIGMSSDEIFALVDEYFILTDDEIKKRKEAERKELEEARRIAEAARNKKTIANKDKKKVNKTKKAEPKSKTEEVGTSQLSLFDEEADSDDSV